MKAGRGSNSFESVIVLSYHSSSNYMMESHQNELRLRACRSKHFHSSFSFHMVVQQSQHAGRFPIQLILITHEGFNSLLETLKWFLLASPLSVCICSSHIIGIELSTNIWVFKCAFTCTHCIVGWDLSIPYHGTFITSGQSRFSVTYALGWKFAPCLYCHACT